MEIKPLLDKREEVIRLFLLNMNLLTPGERGVIIKLLDIMYGFPPIEEEYVRKPIDK
jgi:hypothetical protein